MLRAAAGTVLAPRPLNPRLGHALHHPWLVKCGSLPAGLTFLLRAPIADCGPLVCHGPRLEHRLGGRRRIDTAPFRTAGPWEIIQTNRYGQRESLRHSLVLPYSSDLTNPANHSFKDGV